jgi:xanthine dehydrogenase accessory factor
MKLWKECFELTEKSESFVVVTMTAARGSSPQDPGAKILVTKDGLYAGTVGGGKVEMAAINKALQILEAQVEVPPETITWNLQTDIGMSCGGEVTFLFEHSLMKNWPIVIFGAGHVAQALTRVLSQLNCHVSCIDSREEWTSKLTGVQSFCHPSPKELVQTFNPKSFFLCMTMGHAHDVPILIEIAKHAPDCPYVGVIGSEVKGAKIKKELEQIGVQKDFIQKLRVPIGLPLGKNHPFEIAISIAAELLQVRDQ